MTDTSVLVVGEVLTDVYPDTGSSSPLGQQFVPRIGGAAANVAAALASFGSPPLVWTRVGGDPFGRALSETLTARDVPPRLVTVDDERQTALAFVGLGETGRQFVFYHEGTATESLQFSDSVSDALRAVDWVFVNGFLLAFEPARTALQQFLQQAATADCTVLFDVNARQTAWSDPTVFQSVLTDVLQYVDVVKLSMEDAAMTTYPQATPVELAGAILDAHPHTVFVTRGEDGAYGRSVARAPWGPAEYETGGITVDAVDETGAGDAFCAGIVEALHHRSLGTLGSAVDLGCASGAAVTMAEGALPPVSFAATVASLR